MLTKMKNRFISVLLSTILAYSLVTTSFAAPALADINDNKAEFDFGVIENSVADNTNKGDNSQIFTERDNVVSLSGPQPVEVQDTKYEQDTDFDVPVLYETASLMAELSGDGTKESPYLISSAEDLKLMANNVNTGIGASAYYKLTGNIDLGGMEWSPIGTYTNKDKYSVSFKGHFDGDGHTVSNFRITKYSTTYLGFFGLVSGGEIKNLNIDKFTIEIATEKDSTIYAGGIAGRINTPSPYDSIVLGNCNITNSSIKITNRGTIYAGGAIGSAFTSETGSSLDVSFINVQCDVNAISLAQNVTSSGAQHYTLASGLISSLNTCANTVITVLGCSAAADINSSAIDSLFAQAVAGGLFANVRTIDDNNTKDGKIVIRECFSEGTVYGDSNMYPYVLGGVAGQLYSSTELYIFDCYSSSDISGKYLSAGKYEDPSAGGFVGQAIFLSANNTIKNCYASGDVVDLLHTETTPKDSSFVGGFTAWVETASLKNCYRLESQYVWGSDIDSTDAGNVTALSIEDALIPEKYSGFDFENTWQTDSSGEYAYPTLRAKSSLIRFVYDDILFDVTSFGEDNKAFASSIVPLKASTISKIFSFSHWSLTENGPAFDFENTEVVNNLTFYAVFSSAPRPYTVKFINEGKVFGSEQTLSYGSYVRAPEAIPEKEDSNVYYYTFLHWSDTEGGSAYDFTDCTVIGNMTFYAVYKATDKSAWTGKVADSFHSGYGTKALPYIIKTADQFALFAKVINEQTEGYTDAYYALGNNINLGGNTWVPIGITKEKPFSANFDGRGYTVSNFSLSESDYIGLFGFVQGGTIKNLGISNFTIDVSPSSAASDACVYVGALAGYISSSSYQTSIISSIGITDGTMNINASIYNVYAGYITGYADANVRSQTLISDCFASGDIKVTNSSHLGYNYAGGLAGMLYTGSNSLTKLTNCYHTGSIESRSYHSSRAGGLVGYLYSIGSAYTSSEKEGYVSSDESENYAVLANDTDVMMENCFAVTNVTSHSLFYTSAAGKLTGLCNPHAAVVNSAYPMRGVTITTILGSGNYAATTETNEGISEAPSFYKIIDILAENFGFDFENVWTFSEGYEYPMLSCLVENKPLLSLESFSIEDGKLDAEIKLYSPSEDYTVIIGVYNDRNQPIKIERIRFNYEYATQTINLSYDGMDKAKRLNASVYETKTMLPLFEALDAEIQ